MRRKFFLTFFLIAALSLAACSDKETVSTENKTESEVSAVSTETEKEESSEVNTETEKETEDNETKTSESGFVSLSDKELEEFTDFVREDYNFAFLLCSFSAPNEVDPEVIFHAGIYEEDDPVTEEETAKYMELMGYDELYSSVVRVRREDANNILFEKCGLTYDELDGYFSEREGWAYDFETDTYYKAVSDTNYKAFDVVSGYYLNEEQVVLRCRVTKDFDTNSDTGYRTFDREICLEKYNDSFRFLSSRNLIDEGLITEHCYTFVDMPHGQVNLLTYEPVDGKSDACFVITQDGDIIQYIYRRQNFLSEGLSFGGIEDIGFGDFDNDGTVDFLVIEKMLDTENEVSYQTSVCLGTNYGYLYVEDELGEYLDENLKEYTANEAIKLLTGSEGEISDWKEAYINLLEENDLDCDDFSGGFMLINILPGIPQMACVGCCEAAGTKIASFSELNGNVNVDQLDRLWFTYIENKGLLCNSEGNGGVYYDIVYTLTDSGLTLLKEGSYEAVYNDEYDVIGFNYYWDSNSVSEEEYKALLNEVYPELSASSGYFSLLKRSEMISALKAEYSKLF